MTGQELLDLMAFVEPQYIEEAEVYPIRKNAAWKRWGILAACLCLLLVGAFASRKYIYFGLKTIWSYFSPDNAVQNVQLSPPYHRPSSQEFSSVEKFVLAKRAGELDYLLPDWDHFYLLANAPEDYSLDSIKVSENRVDFCYMQEEYQEVSPSETLPPEGSDKQEYNNPNAKPLPTIRKIVFSQSRKDAEHSLEKISQQIGYQINNAGSIYKKERGELYFERDGFFFAIDCKNSKIQAYYEVKAKTFSEYDLQAYFDVLAATSANPNASVQIDYLEEYEVFLSVQQESSFISYEQVKALGTFCGFSRSAYQNGEADYAYNFIVDQETRLRLKITRNEGRATSLHWYPYLSGPIDNDFRKVATKETVCIQHNGLTYLYSRYSLLAIVWEQDGIFFSLELLNKATDFSRKLIDDSTLFAKLLLGEVEAPVFPDIPAE